MLESLDSRFACLSLIDAENSCLNFLETRDSCLSLYFLVHVFNIKIATWLCTWNFESILCPGLIDTVTAVLAIDIHMYHNSTMFTIFYLSTIHISLNRDVIQTRADNLLMHISWFCYQNYLVNDKLNSPGKNPDVQHFNMSV